MPLEFKKYNGGFTGKYLGSVGKLLGDDSQIEIDPIDCWLNYNKNILLLVKKSKKTLLCSEALSNIIRLNKLDENTEALKEYSVYEFEDGVIYATHLIEYFMEE